MQRSHSERSHSESAKKQFRTRSIGVAGLVLAGMVGLTLTGITAASAASTTVLLAPTPENPNFVTVGHSDGSVEDDERTRASNLAHANDLASLPASDLCEAAGYPSGINPTGSQVIEEQDGTFRAIYRGTCLPR